MRIPMPCSTRSRRTPTAWRSSPTTPAPTAWSRGLTIGTDRSDVRRLLEHALHDSSHHLVDVERGLARLRAE